MLAATSADHFLDTALDALSSGEADSRAVLDGLPVPVYTTDAGGSVTYWNRACVEFAGREPQLGQDRWCVTWQIYTTVGDLLPHDQCPMAVAVREQRPIRGTVAIAARPDGSRAAFTPYPTPLFDDSGRLTGAVNMLIDVSASQAVHLREQAERCRRLARDINDQSVRTMLSAMAQGYDRTVAALAS